MNLEQLNAMSDAELNELSAVKVMGWEKSFVFEGKRYNGVYGKEAIQRDWNPTTDMNDAMELQKKLGELRFIEYTVNLFEMAGHNGDLNFGAVADILKLSPRDHTIAIIMAETDEQLDRIYGS